MKVLQKQQTLDEFFRYRMKVSAVAQIAELAPPRISDYLHGLPTNEDVAQRIEQAVAGIAAVQRAINPFLFQIPDRETYKQLRRVLIDRGVGLLFTEALKTTDVQNADAAL